MTVQVLVATMNQAAGDHSLLQKMNIQSDVIVCNQCDRYEAEEFTYNGHRVRWLSFAERGVGLNRNNALMRADADIVLFSDDDVRYEDGYAERVVRFYEENPTADVVIFNMLWRRAADQPFEEKVKRTGRVHRKGVTKYGTVCVSARLSRLRFANVNFHLNFGGGATYSCGEDSLFLQDCVAKKLRVFTCTSILGRVECGESSWFEGYTDKFFFDKGVLYFAMNRYLCKGYALYHCVKHRRRYAEYGWWAAYRQMCRGIREGATK